MMTSASSERPARISSPHGGASYTAIDLRDLEETRPPVDIKSSPSSDNRLLHPTVQIAPAEFVKRLGTGCPGWFAGSIHAPLWGAIELGFKGPGPLLVMYNGGPRRDGETSVDG